MWQHADPTVLLHGTRYAGIFYRLVGGLKDMAQKGARRNIQSKIDYKRLRGLRVCVCVCWMQSGGKSVECIRATSLCVVQCEAKSQLSWLIFATGIPFSWSLWIPFFFRVWGCHMAMTMSYDWKGIPVGGWDLGLAPFCQAILKP